MKSISKKISSAVLRWLGAEPNTIGSESGGLELLARGAGGSFAVNVAGRLIAVGIQILLARYLGVDSYGIYVTVIAGVNVLYVALNLGLDASAVKFIPRYEALQQYGRIRGFISYSIRMVCIQSALAAVLAAGIIFVSGHKADHALFPALWAALALLPFKALLQLVSSLLRAFKCVVRSLVLTTVLQPLAFAAAIVLTVHIFGKQITSPSALALNAVVTALALIAGLLLLTRSRPDELRNAAPERSNREWLAVSLPLFLITAFQLILTNTDVLMVGALAGTTESGIYRAASQIGIMVSFGLNCANMILAPMISDLHTRHQKEQLQRLLKISSRAILVYSMSVLLFFILLGKWLLSLFSPEFVSGYPVLIILSTAYMVISSSGPVGFLMTMTGNHREAAWIIGGTAVLNVALNALLISSYGSIGAAVATAVAIATRSIVLSILVKRRLGVTAHAFS
jgi:O-antigen/teichoic acid export membrane protein